MSPLDTIILPSAVAGEFFKLITGSEFIVNFSSLKLAISIPLTCLFVSLIT